MGIQGLLPFLKSIHRPTNVSSYRGGAVAVDAYCWLHKGAFSCAQQLVMKEGNVDNLPFVAYCMKRVNMLRENNIKVIMVFDGGYLPVKAGVESERRAKRQEYRKRGKDLLKDGKRSEAIDCFQKCVDVSPEMALAFIKACRSVGVECIVAPYEADAQLAYLSREGIVDLVITEDSDLLVFGCKQVLFKMDENGSGVLIELSRLGQVEGGKLQGFDEKSFRHMCILSGCDYLPSIPGMGLATANKMLKKFGRDPHKVIAHMKMQKGKAVPELYSEGFKQAEETFLFQLVFDPRTQKQTRLNPVPDDVECADFEFAGSEVSPRKAVGLARGNINPLTFEVMAYYSPCKANPPLHSDPSPVRHKGQAGPVMGGTNRHYPVGVQAKMHVYSSSRRSAAQFKPPTLVQHDDGVCLTNSELLAMYSTGSKEQPREEGEVPVHVGGEGEVIIDKCTITGEVTQPQSGVRRTTVSRFFKASEAAVTGDRNDEITPANSQPSLLSRLVGCRELQFSEQQGEEDGRGQQALEERGLIVSKNLAELFADREEEEGSKAWERTTAGVCYQSVVNEEQRDGEARSNGEESGCHPVRQHPVCPVSESVSSEGAFDSSNTSIGAASIQHMAPPASCGPPAKKVRRSLQGFLFTSQSSDPSQQTVVSMKMECNTRDGNRFMQQEDFLSSGIGYLHRAPPGENTGAASPPPSLPTQERHSCMNRLPPEDQSSTIDLTAADTPTVLGRVRQRAAGTSRVKRPGLSRPGKSNLASFRTPQRCSESQSTSAGQSTLMAVLQRCQYTKREGLKRS